MAGGGTGMMAGGDINKALQGGGTQAAGHQSLAPWLMGQGLGMMQGGHMPMAPQIPMHHGGMPGQMGGMTMPTPMMPPQMQAQGMNQMNPSMMSALLARQNGLMGNGRQL